LHETRGVLVGQIREDAVCEAVRLKYRGYGVSLAYKTEEPTSLRDCEETKNELLRLVGMLGIAGRSSTISVDLSRIGLNVSDELAYRHLAELIGEAAIFGMSIMINAEEPSKTERILRIYERAADRYSSLGITLQAGLPGAERDLGDILPLRGRIRIVKGEHRDLGSSAAAEGTFLRLVEQAIASGRFVSIATHDEAIHREARRRGLLSTMNAEIEMLHGVRTDLLQTLKESGGKPRVYLPYGRKPSMA